MATLWNDSYQNIFVHALICLAGALFLFYAVYHFAHGRRGYFALQDVQISLKQAEQELANQQQIEAILSARIRLLHPRSMNLDMLDEQARRVLGYGEAGERIFVYDKQQMDVVAADVMPHKQALVSTSSVR
jgi:cell division protein FtsB